MDVKVWIEQVEAALESNQGAFLQVLDKLAPPGGGEVALVRCRLRVAQGDLPGAAAAFPELAAIEEDPTLHRPWALAAVDLALAGAIPNHWGLGRALSGLAERAMDRRAPADALDILERHVRAAMARGARQVALRGVDLARAVVDPPDPDAPRLSRRRRRAAEQAIDALHAQAQALPTPAPEDPSALLAALGADPERDLDRLAATWAAHPTRADLLHAAAHSWQALDDDAAGTDLFAGAVATHPQDVELATAFGWHLVRRRDLITLDAWVTQRFLPDPDPAVQARGHWLLARARLDRAATGAARASVERLLALQPDSLPGRHLRAQVARAEGDRAGALDQLAALAGDPAAPPAISWECLELGTLLGRWAEVRAVAARLGMPVLPGEGPIDQDWGPCRVLRPWVEGPPVAATRTGPVTARLEGDEHGGEVVLLRAEALDSGGEGGPLLRALERLARG